VLTVFSLARLSWRTRATAAAAAAVWSMAVIAACRADTYLLLIIISLHRHIQHLITLLIITALVLIWAAAAVKLVLTVRWRRRRLSPWRLWLLRPTSDNHSVHCIDHVCYHITASGQLRTPGAWFTKRLTNFRKIFVKSLHLGPESTSYDFVSFSYEFLHARLMFS